MLSTRLLSRRFRLPAISFHATAEDGVGLAGARAGVDGPSLVFCHGFLGWHRKPRVVAFVEQMARRFAVYTFDFRGHGASGGASTYGDLYRRAREPKRLMVSSRFGHAEDGLTPAFAERVTQRIHEALGLTSSL